MLAIVENGDISFCRQPGGCMNTHLGRLPYICMRRCTAPWPIELLGMHRQTHIITPDDTVATQMFDFFKSLLTSYRAYFTHLNYPMYGFRSHVHVAVTDPAHFVCVKQMAPYRATQLALYTLWVQKHHPLRHLYLYAAKPLMEPQSLERCSKWCRQEARNTPTVEGNAPMIQLMSSLPNL